MRAPLSELEDLLSESEALPAVVPEVEGIKASIFESLLGPATFKRGFALEAYATLVPCLPARALVPAAVPPRVASELEARFGGPGEEGEE